MAQRVEVLLLDDLTKYQTDGKEEAPAVETVQFSYRGTDYEIDLGDLNAGEFDEQMEVWIEAGRKVHGRTRASRSKASRVKSADIRAWAKKMGIEVSDRGRIPAEVVADYEANH